MAIPGWQDLIVCGVSEPAQYAHPCGFSDLLVLAKNLITDMVVLGTMATVFVAMYAGILLITAGFRGDTKALDNAKRMFGNILKGYLVIIVAWVLVYTIITALVAPELSLLGHV